MLESRTVSPVPKSPVLSKGTAFFVFTGSAGTVLPEPTELGVPGLGDGTAVCLPADDVAVGPAEGEGEPLD
jgi:hypothetical protein